MAEREHALDTLSREDLGIDPGEPGGPACEAAGRSFGLVALGAILPVAPVAFFTAMSAGIARAGLSAMALFVIGAALLELFHDEGIDVWLDIQVSRVEGHSGQDGARPRQGRAWHTDSRRH